MEETKLRQLFKNRADAYLNTIDESVEQGMSEDCFIKAVNEAINYTHCCETFFCNDERSKDGKCPEQCGVCSEYVSR